MIEGLFHGLKNRYLYHQKIKNIEDVKRKANFYFRQHNEVVPLNVLKGERPLEVFQSSWGAPERSELQLNKERAFQSRKQKNLEPPCNASISKNRRDYSGQQLLRFDLEWPTDCRGIRL